MKKTSPSHPSRRTGCDHPDLYQQVTDTIIAAIERGTLPWRKPWRTDRNPVYQEDMMPRNGLTGYHYSGVNVLLLWMAAEEKGYASDRWLTWRQAAVAGGHVRAGETATLAVVFRPWDKPVKDADGR